MVRLWCRMRMGFEALGAAIRATSPNIILYAFDLLHLDGIQRRKIGGVIHTLDGLAPALADKPKPRCEGPGLRKRRALSLDRPMVGR
jgi:hypothetical protein